MWGKCLGTDNVDLQVKEVIISFFILMEQGKATSKVQIICTAFFLLRLVYLIWENKDSEVRKMHKYGATYSQVYYDLKEDLDQQCERLLKEEFGESCNFDVDDAVQKLEKLGIVIQVRLVFSVVSQRLWLSYVEFFIFNSLDCWYSNCFVW